MRKKPWRVRVMLLTEGWVSVEAIDAYTAELEAVKFPNVQKVFSRSATIANQVVGAEKPVGVEEE